MIDLIAHYGGQQGSVPVQLGPMLGSGAVGDVYRLHAHPGVVAKIYKVPSDRAHYERKIEEMIQRPPNLPPIRTNGREYVQIAWPTASLRDGAGTFLGFVMPEIELTVATELDNILQRSTRSIRGLPEFYGARILLAANLAGLMVQLHALAHYFTDMKPANIRFYPDTCYLAILDADGFSIQGRERWPARQFSDEYIAPEARGLDPSKLGIEQDHFALATIIFRLMNNGVHPYQGIDRRPVYPSALQERIFDRLYAYCVRPRPDIQPAVSSIHDYLEATTRAMFDRAFAGHPSERPSAREWQEHLGNLVTGNILTKCSRHPAEHAHFSKGCGLCALDARRAKIASGQGGQPASGPTAAASAGAPRRTWSIFQFRHRLGMSVAALERLAGRLTRRIGKLRLVNKALRLVLLVGALLVIGVGAAMLRQPAQAFVEAATTHLAPPPETTKPTDGLRVSSTRFGYLTRDFGLASEESTLPTVTSNVGVHFKYTGAIPRRTRFSIVIRHNGSVYTDCQTDVMNVAASDYACRWPSITWKPGRYQVLVISDNHVRGWTTFRVK